MYHARVSSLLYIHYDYTTLQYIFIIFNVALGQRAGGQKVCTSAHCTANQIHQ